LRRFDALRKLHSVSGIYDFVAEVEAGSVEWSAPAPPS
jgi:hypothetical protein